MATMSNNDNGTGSGSGNKNDEEDDAPTILLVGACCLDRLFMVSKYPAADAKIRSTSYKETGGGNSANSACAIAKLAGAELFSSSGQSMIRVEFLTKVGDDSAGQSLIEEMNALDVGTTLPLFRIVPGSTTAHTAIIVSESEETRTCIHTPGSGGELSMTEDVETLSSDDVDALFRNVRHVHSDSRHTDVALWMTKEAKRRGITVSCDCEKDRYTDALDELIEVCDVLFTNSNHLGEYLGRLTREREEDTGRQALPEPTITVDTKGAGSGSGSMTPLSLEIAKTYVDSLTPSAYFARWQDEKFVLRKEVVVTHGAMGALHYKAVEYRNWHSDGGSKRQNTIEIEMVDTNLLCMRHSFDDGKEGANILYEIHQAGILKHSKVVDTTGAGDSFIGGYILAKTALERGEEEVSGGRVQFALEMGSFVAGCKVGGSGWAALPTFKDVDDRLGVSAADAKASLVGAIGSFNNGENKETHSSC